MKLPKSWKSISIKQYLAIDTIVKDDTLEPVERSIQILSAVTGKSIEYFETLPINQLKRCIEKIQFLNNPDSISKKLPVAFILKGKVYSTSWKVSTLTGGQYIDLNVFTKDKEAIAANLHNIMAVLCVPRKWGIFKGKYNGTQHKQRADLFHENLSMAIAYPLAVFFCNLLISLTPHIVHSLEQQVLEREMRRPETAMPILNSGAGL